MAKLANLRAEPKFKQAAYAAFLRLKSRSRCILRLCGYHFAQAGLMLTCCATAATGTPIDQAQAACRTNVTSGAELTAALEQTDCGCVIALANGAYTGEFGLQQVCPADRPIIVRAEWMLAAILHSPLRLEGEHATVYGVHFEGPNTGLTVGGIANRVLRNRFSGWRDVALRLIAGHGAEIGYNEFSEPAPWSPGNEVCPTELRRMAIYSSELICSGSMNGGFHWDARVHHNYFHDFPLRPDPENYSSGQTDAIEICGGRQEISDRRSNWFIEYNLIERHLGGYGAVDIKCGGTVVQYNTIIASPGSRIDFRSGSHNVLAGNWIEDAGGSVIHGGHHLILGNSMSRFDTGGYPNLATGLVLTAGNVPWDYTGPTRLMDNTSAHQAAYKVVLAGNTVDNLHVGWKRSKRFVYATRDTSIEQHAGLIKLGFQENTIEQTWTSRTVPIAFRLTASSVGPFASLAPP